MRLFTPEPSVARPAAVYLLQRLDRRRFKVGWSDDPRRRFQELPEHESRVLDLASTAMLWLPNRQRAVQVEGALHKMLALHRTEAAHRRDGYSEWFRQSALPLALTALSRMPINARAERGKVVTLDGATVAEAFVEERPMPRWWALEDLWSRLAQCVRVGADLRGEPEIVIHAFRHAYTPAVADLRAQVMDVDTYGWQAKGARGTFMRVLEYRCDDLVCTLTPLRVIERWPDGDEVAWRVKEFLLRLRRTGTLVSWPQPIRLG